VENGSVLIVTKEEFTEIRSEKATFVPWKSVEVKQEGEGKEKDAQPKEEKMP